MKETKTASKANCCGGKNGVAMTVGLISFGVIVGLLVIILNKVNLIAEKTDAIVTYTTVNFWGEEAAKILNENYFSKESFKKEGVARANETLKQLKEQDPTMELENETEVQDNEDPVIKKILNEEDWTDRFGEAHTVFGAQGTPTNIIMNRKTWDWKALGGASPKSSFEKEIKDFEAGTKDGTLAKETIDTVLKNVFFYEDKETDLIILEYSDLLCPACQYHYKNQTVESIAKNNPEISLVLKQAPLAMHPKAAIWAKAAECAGEINGAAGYYAFLEKAFDHNTYTREIITEIVEEINLDKDIFDSCFSR